MTGPIARFDGTQEAFALTATGALGPTAQREFARMENKFPLGYAQCDGVQEPGLLRRAGRRGPPAQSTNSDDARLVTNHIKSLGYFLFGQHRRRLQAASVGCLCSECSSVISPSSC